MLDHDIPRELTPPGKGLDLTFLGKPHEHDPRRVYSTTGADWQARVDFARLRKDRLQRAQRLIERMGLVFLWLPADARQARACSRGIEIS